VEISPRIGVLLPDDSEKLIRDTIVRDPRRYGRQKLQAQVLD
jgi:hypothetical protein